MVIVKQISSLEKIRNNDLLNYTEINKNVLLKGERCSYQIAIKSDEQLNGIIEVDSPYNEYINVYKVLNAVMDAPITDPSAVNDIDYITKEAGLMPDILQPIDECENSLMTWTTSVSLWVEINIPQKTVIDNFKVEIKYIDRDTKNIFFSKCMDIEICDNEIEKQELIYSRWLYVDCIADYHNVEVYSEKHWQLIESYIKAAVNDGMNMVLVPVHTPPLDTDIGAFRTCVQLVDIEKIADEYIFDFSKFEKYIELSKRCGIEYFEIAHMFSQWGAKYSPNIRVKENGETSYMFGWHVASDSEEYVCFLKKYIFAISDEIKKLGLSEKTYFHISDEPAMEYINSYEKAKNIIKPLIGDMKSFDAISDIDFYEKGLVETPVTSIHHIKPFLEHKVENQWLYYCCFPQYKYTNSTLAMPLSRARILGILLYKFDIKGFLHWGLNFYNGQFSRYTINPYVTTSSDGRFPSGDPFILYPSKDGAYSSMRAKATFDAIQDMNICKTLEKIIGREKVVAMIDEEAGFNVTFEEYPKGSEYITKLIEKMKVRLISDIRV